MDVTDYLNSIAGLQAQLRWSEEKRLDAEQDRARLRDAANDVNYLKVAVARLTEQKTHLKSSLQWHNKVLRRLRWQLVLALVCMFIAGATIALYSKLDIVIAISLFVAIGLVVMFAGLTAIDAYEINRFYD